MNGNYPANLWYVAATSEELVDRPLGRRLLDQEVVLWRDADGTAHALADRCAHRGFPLSDGHVDANLLVCGYHGCSYRPDGQCVHIPTQPAIPPAMQVHRYLIYEEPPFVWIWLGRMSPPSKSRPPRLPWLTDPGWTTFPSIWSVGANYLMVHEHFLDFSYAPIVHENHMPPGTARLPAFSSVEVTETSVTYTRELAAMPAADWERDAVGLDAERLYSRTESGTFVSPAVHMQRWDIAGDGLLSSIRTHALTPESATRTHVFQQSSRNYSLNDTQVTETLEKFVTTLIERDTAVLERVADYDIWRSSVEFQADTAALRARRIVAAMLTREAGRSPLRPGWAPVLDMQN